jgi:hypothetical protein
MWKGEMLLDTTVEDGRKYKKSKLLLQHFCEEMQ